MNTASRALTGKPDVSDATRAKVIEMARRLGYRPNLFARGLRGQRVGVLGVVVADLSNPFFVEVTRGIEEEAHRRGYTIVLANTGEDPAKELEVIETLLEQQVSGILLTPSQGSLAPLERMEEEGVPYVLVARRFAGRESNAVLNDDFGGARQAVSHLLDLGHRRILLINGPLSNWSAARRYAGYRQALVDFGLDPKVAAWMMSCEVTAAGASRAVGRAVDEHGPPDAVFTFSDYMAIGVIQALRKKGLGVPKDVSVMGFDGIEVGGFLDPPLSTVEISTHRLGIAGARMLLDLIQGEWDGGAKELVLPSRIVRRGSTAPRSN